MKYRLALAALVTTAVVGGALLAPSAAGAQMRRYRESERRQQTKNEWRNIAIGAGALSVLGLLNNDKTLTFAGAAGALYSLNRYEQDRKSQNRLDRARAAYFAHEDYWRDGHRYVRRTVVRGGQRYYQFAREGWTDSRPGRRVGPPMMRPDNHRPDARPGRRVGPPSQRPDDRRPDTHGRDWRDRSDRQPGRDRG